MSYPIKRPDVLLVLINAVEAGTIRLTFHVLQRMKERGIVLNDVHEAIYNSKREDSKDVFNAETGDWKYVVRGFNSDGDKEIRIAFVIKDPVTLILTVIDLRK